MIEYTLFCVVLLSCVYQTTWLRGSDSIYQTLSCLEKNKNKDQFGSWLILLRWFKWSDSLKRARISITSLWVQQIKGKKNLDLLKLRVNRPYESMWKESIRLWINHHEQRCLCTSPRLRFMLDKAAQNQYICDLCCDFCVLCWISY